MLELKNNYLRKEDMKCPISNGKEGTAHHVLECQTAETVYRIKHNTHNQYVEVLMIYRQNKIKGKRRNKSKKEA